MAETIVTFALDKVLQFVTTEVGLLRSLKEEVESIRDELHSIKAVMKDAEKQAEDNDGVKEWVGQVRKVAYQIEDVLDEYFLLKQQQQHHPLPHVQEAMPTCFHAKELLAKVTRCFTPVSTVIPKHELAMTIQTIKEEISMIKMRRETYDFITTERVNNENDVSWQDIRSLYEDDSELVGIEGPKGEVIKLLQHSPLVAVVGMGGLGKTTLTRKVYNQISLIPSGSDTETKWHLRAWITVSQSYSVVDLLKSIYEQFLKSAHEDWSQVDRLRDVRSIIEELRSYLNDGGKKRYLVVLDDVWEEMPLIDFIRAVLPANDEESRIMMTTRDEGIATSWATKFKGQIYGLTSLSTAEAWSLFCKKTFVSGDCPAELKLLAEEIVKKCEGLPLVLVAIGGLLSSKNSSYSEWKKLRDTLGSEYEKHGQLERSARILLLSYRELPYHLKPCFLYFGMFPEDYSINRMRLVRLWIAEGFIESRQRKTLEEAALEYLTVLVKRNLIQVSERDGMGRCRSYRVHDVLREIILSKLKESGFAQVMSKDSSPRRNTCFRRLSVFTSFDDSIQHCNTTCNIRTVLVFDNQMLSSFLTGSQPKLLRLLRVLDLQGALIDVIPEELGELHNLHFLSIRNTKVKMLPKSIARLLNLQTLDLTKSKVSHIPSEAKCLIKMRHLLLTKSSVRDTGVPTKIAVGVLENFRNLQNLEGMNVMGNRSIIMELSKLKQLTKLEIEDLREEDSDDLCRAIEGMEHLRSLSLNWDRVLNLETLTRPPRFLESLTLRGHLKQLPDWVQRLGNLSVLVLVFSNLDDDPAWMLQGLSNLVYLYLSLAYNGAELNFGDNGYKKLKRIYLVGLSNLKSVKGALPALRQLTYTAREEQIDVPPHIQPYVNHRWE